MKTKLLTRSTSINNKTCQHNSDGENFPQYKKAHLYKPTVSIILTGEKLKSFPMRSDGKDNNCIHFFHKVL